MSSKKNSGASWALISYHNIVKQFNQKMSHLDKEISKASDTIKDIKDLKISPETRLTMLKLVGNKHAGGVLTEQLNHYEAALNDTWVITQKVRDRLHNLELSFNWALFLHNHAIFSLDGDAMQAMKEYLAVIQKPKVFLYDDDKKKKSKKKIVKD